jgi:primosomal protein N' (replication factor Y)
MFAQVALNLPLQQTFTYAVPEALQASVRVGHLVRVGFGTGVQHGVIVRLTDTSTIASPKPIQALLDPQPVLSERHVRCAEWLAERTLAPIGLAIWLWLPPALTRKATRIVTLEDPHAVSDHPLEWEIISLLRLKSPQKLGALERELGGKQGMMPALKRLETAGVLRIEAVLTPPGVRPKTVRTVWLAVEASRLPEYALSPKQARIVEHVARLAYPQDALDVQTATQATSTDLLKLERKGVLGFGERVVYRDSLADRDFVAVRPPELTDEQAQAWAALRHALEGAPAYHGFLLHGVTGSGKTELYLRAIAQVIAQGRQAILLVPEIALTPQTIRRVASRFTGRTAVVHSGLSDGERFDTWQRARQGELDVIVGTRSALFTPLPDCGLIILDEEHDPSYKQSPPILPPYYHARAVAEYMMRQVQGTLILGSATPDLETFYRAEAGELAYLHLPNRLIGHKERLHGQAQRLGTTLKYESIGADAMALGLPPVHVVDMREELKRGNTRMFSDALMSALTQVLARGEQAILFLNRRGQASYVFCRDCGYVAHCPRCEMPLTYHREGEALLCHHCGYKNPPLHVCPACTSKRIKHFGAGTQQVEEELARHFPQVRAVRWDADTAQKPADHEALLARFIAHEADVIVGTQMIAKGLDLPLVTLVGVVSADTSLALPDFRTAERAFQLLTQVAGRAGRGVLGGQVILQTYQPDHESIVSASQHDYAQFYAVEIARRRELGYPPFRRLGRVLVQSAHPYEAERTANAIAKQAQEVIKAHALTDAALIGPAPCFFAKIDNLYRWHLLIRSADPAQVLRHVTLPHGCALDLDPTDVL